MQTILTCKTSLVFFQTVAGSEVVLVPPRTIQMHD